MVSENPMDKANENIPEDFLQLVWNYFEGPADPQVVMELNRQMMDSPTKRRWFREFALTRAALIETMGKSAGGTVPTGSGNGQRLVRKTGSKGSALLKAPMQSLWHRLNARRLVFLSGLLTVAAVAVVAATVLFITPGRHLQPTPDTALRILASHDAQWADVNKTGKSGQVHSRGNISLVHGLAEVTLANGVNLVLLSPVTLRVHSPIYVTLVSGRLVATVPHKDIGFTVATTQGDITDLGTQFGVKAGPQKPTITCVFRGYVRAAIRNSAGRLLASRVLVARQAARMELTETHGRPRAVLSLIPPPPLGFITPENLKSAIR